MQVKAAGLRETSREEKLAFITDKVQLGRIMTPEQLDAHVTGYVRVRPELISVAAHISEDVRQVIQPVAADAMVESRAKQVGSFAEKILRKRKYVEPLREITDLVGVRVITHLTTETHQVVARLRERFVVDERNSMDKAHELRSGEFGYLSQHLVLILDKADIRSANLPDSMLPLRIEVQVRTLLQHAWSAIGHDRLYKSGFRVPERWLRMAARIAASLELADAEFVALTSGLDAYQGEFGVALEPNVIEEERKVVALVRKHAPSDPALAERQARLALSVEDWEQAKASVEEFDGERTAGLWCCLGLALCGQGGGLNSGNGTDAGTRAFRSALAVDGNNREALLLLAQRLEQEAPEEAASLFARVLRKDPHDPHALAGSLRVAARRGECQPCLNLWGSLANEAIWRCDTLIEVGVDLVAALRFRAVFLLMREVDAGTGLAALAEAIHACRHTQALREMLHEVTALRPLRKERPALEAAWRMVSLALLARVADDETRVLVDDWAGEALPIRPPVWIIAGGCASEADETIASVSQMLEPAFRDFCGTVISGGTRQGVAGLVGNAAQQEQARFTSLGYLPVGLISSDSITPDDRYSELRRKEVGEGFSWNEPLHMWADILRAGIPPAQVALLGINGGAIAGFEYRLAAALGARVGVMSDTGRAASVLDLPSERKRFPSILRLPTDAATVGLFLLRQGSGLELNPEALERLAKRAHEAYLKSVPARVEPSHEPWERLDESLKDSNRDQVRRSIEVLRVGGFSVQPLTGESRIREFSTEEIEVLAEAEHGRWVLERLESGWVFGPVKDVAQKRSPHLVPWGQLGDDVKEWDRRAVRDLGRRLAEEGLAITRSARLAISSTSREV